jgi:hypothetical protein
LGTAGSGPDDCPSSHRPPLTIAQLLAAPLTPAEAAELHARAVAHHRATSAPLSSSPGEEIYAGLSISMTC